MVSKEELRSTIIEKEKEIVSLKEEISLMKKQFEQEIETARQEERNKMYEQWKSEQGIFVKRYISEMISEELSGPSLKNTIKNVVKSHLTLDENYSGDYYSSYKDIYLKWDKETIGEASIKLD